MARPVDPTSRFSNEGVHYGGDMLRAKSQQIFSAVSMVRRDGHKQRPSGMQLGDSASKKNHGGYSIRTITNENETSGFRKRTEELKNVGLKPIETRRVGISSEEKGEFVRPGGVCEQGNGMPKFRKNVFVGDDVGNCFSNEKAGQNTFVGGRNGLKREDNKRNQIQSFRDGVDSEIEVLKGKDLGYGVNDVLKKGPGELSQDCSNLDKNGSRMPDRRIKINSFVAKSKEREFDGKTEVKGAASEVTSRTRIVVNSKSFARDDSKSKFEGKDNEIGDGSQGKLGARSVNDKQQNKADIPKLELDKNDAESVDKLYKNDRYKKGVKSPVQIVDFGNQRTFKGPEVRSSIGKGSQVMDARGKIVSKSLDGVEERAQNSDKLVKIKEASIEVMHIRQTSDPTSQFGVRKLSSVSQDLMRSKEELVNRSRECGRMLEQYKQRNEERREQMSNSDRRVDLPPRPTERKSLSRDGSNDSGSVRASFDENANRSGILKRLYADKVSEQYDEEGKQSPKFGKRKSSYIDSWLQSQQSRISSLVSAIKEEDSDDNTSVAARRSENSSRDRTKSMPPNSMLVSSWLKSNESADDIPEPIHKRSFSGDDVLGVGRRDNLPSYSDFKSRKLSSYSKSYESAENDNELIRHRSNSGEEVMGIPRATNLTRYTGNKSFSSDVSSYPKRNEPVDNTDEPDHKRSYSGEEVMGIPRTSNLARYSDARNNTSKNNTPKSNTPRDSPRNRSRAESPKHSDGYNPNDMRLRSYHIQKESSQISRRESLERKSRRSSSNMSPVGTDEGNNFRPIDVSSPRNKTELTSPRSQSERTSPHVNRSFDLNKSVSLGNSPKLRKETTFDGDIITQVVAESESSISPRPIASRCSSTASDYSFREPVKYGSLPRSPRKSSAPNDVFFGEQKYGSLPRSPSPRKISSPIDYVSGEQGAQQFNSLPRSISPRRSSNDNYPIQSQLSPTTKQGSSFIDNIAKQQGTSRQQQQKQQVSVDMDTSGRSSNDDKFDWPAPPDFDSSTFDDDANNQSWPNGNGSASPFANGRGHLEGSRNFPVAVVKPLQHEKSRSLDGNDPKEQVKIITQRSEHVTKNDVRNQQLPDQTVNCYNMRIEQETSSRPATLSHEIPRDLSSHSSQEFHEKAVDVVFDSEKRSLQDSSDAEQAPGISNLITQDFHWYKPGNQNLDARRSFDRDDPTRESTQGSPRDSTHERLGRFKRGSKLLSSKYQSFSKSLENLSKVGKDFIKNKKKGTEGKDEKKNEKGEGKKSGKNKTERKSVILGDLQLNDEFAMKMERRNRLSMEESFDSTSKQGNAGSRQNQINSRPNNTETRQSVPETRKSNTEMRQFKDGAAHLNSRTNLNRSLNSSNSSSLNDEPSVPGKRRISESPRNKSENNVITLHEPDSKAVNHFRRGGAKVETEFGVRDSIRRREVKSEYFETIEVQEQHLTRPKSEFFVGDDRSSLGSARGSNPGFVDYDEADDEDEKEMVKIVRKISGLRSSQMKIKKHGGKGSRDDLFEEGEKLEDDIEKKIEKESSGNVLELREEKKIVDNEKQAVKTELPTQTEKSPDDFEHEQQPESSNEKLPSSEITSQGGKSNPDPVKRFSSSLSRVMMDLRELREQDLTLATQLITLGKSIKHFKQQKKEMDDLYAELNEGESTEDDTDSSDEEEPAASYSKSRVTTDF